MQKGVWKKRLFFIYWRSRKIGFKKKYSRSIWSKQGLGVLSLFLVLFWFSFFRTGVSFLNFEWSLKARPTSTVLKQDIFFCLQVTGFFLNWLNAIGLSYSQRNFKRNSLFKLKNDQNLFKTYHVLPEQNKPQTSV